MAHPLNLVRRDHGKLAYRFKCRFGIPAYPPASLLEARTFKAMEQFVADMRAQGYEYTPGRYVPSERGFFRTGPYVRTPITSLPSRADMRRTSARDELPMVMAGYREQAAPKAWAVSVPLLGETDKWEYQISAVFVCDALFAEIPDTHEERKVMSA